jgi:hypothetical protein
MSRMEIAMGSLVSALVLAGALCGPNIPEPGTLGDPVWRAEQERVDTVPPPTPRPRRRASYSTPKPVTDDPTVASSPLSAKRRKTIERKLEAIKRIDDPAERTQKKANILRSLPPSVVNDALKDTIQQRVEESQDSRALTPTPEAR